MPKCEGEYSTVTIRAMADTTKAIQVRPGTHRLELSEINPQSAPQQEWRVQGELIQHVQTGFYLDAPVEYIFNHREEPWEAGGSLCVRPRDLEDPDRQRCPEPLASVVLPWSCLNLILHHESQVVVRRQSAPPHDGRSRSGRQLLAD